MNEDNYICLPQPKFARLLEIFGALLAALEANCEAAANNVQVSRPMAGKLLGAIAEVRLELVEIGASAVVGKPLHNDPHGPRLAVH